MITDEDEAIARVISMVKNHTVKAVTGKEIEVQADSVCLHGDSMKALVFAKKISQALKENGISIVSLREEIA
jgi:UPF0271 protein